MGMSSYTPGHIQRRQIGITSSKWPASDHFHAAMRPYGMQVKERLVGAGLAPLQPGQALGATYYRGMKNSYEYVKNPYGNGTGGAHGGTNEMISGPGGDVQMIEKK